MLAAECRMPSAGCGLRAAGCGLLNADGSRMKGECGPGRNECGRGGGGGNGWPRGEHVGRAPAGCAQRAGGREGWWERRRVLRAAQRWWRPSRTAADGGLSSARPARARPCSGAEHAGDGAPAAPFWKQRGRGTRAQGPRGHAQCEARHHTPHAPGVPDVTCCVPCVMRAGARVPRHSPRAAQCLKVPRRAAQCRAMRRLAHAWALRCQGPRSRRTVRATWSPRPTTWRPQPAIDPRPAHRPPAAAAT